SPDNPPWSIWAAIGVWFASVLFIILLPNLFVLPYLAKQTFNLADAEKLKEFAQSDPTAIMLQLGAVIPAHLLTILLGWLVVTSFRKYSFKEMLGWEWNGFKIWHSIVIFVFFYLVALSLITIFGDVENDFERMLKNSRLAVYFVAFFATFTAPLVEEMVYRGLLYSAFQRKFGVSLAVVFVTLLFTLVHVPQYSLNQVPDYASVITILLLSLTLTLIRVRTNNLLPCIVLHTVFNGIQSALLVAEPYLRQLVTEPQAQPAFFFLK
ncbi:MAG: CPBP family intramembrane glutamic endopeptidase, partial [Acidobacteriota bacterium]